MAVRRMLHGEILKSDSFLSMPFRAQMLYVQIAMAADDDGFCNGAEGIMRIIGAKKTDLRLLVERRFLLQFDKVVVVKHWRMANSLKNDRLKGLAYPEIAEKLYIKKNRAYTDHPQEGARNLKEMREEMMGIRNPDGIPVEEKRKEENRKEMKRAEEEAPGIPVAAATAAPERLNKMDGVLGKGVLMLTERQMDDLLEQMGIDDFDYYTDKLSSFIVENHAKVKNHYDTILKWWKEDTML